MRWKKHFYLIKFPSSLLAVQAAAALDIVNTLENKQEKNYNKEMSYSKDYRKRTIEYREEGHTLEETHRVFKVSISTIRTWEKQWKEKGTLTPAPVVRKYKKIDPERLKAYVQEHPDAYPSEIAKEFNCCETAIRKAFGRLGITRKKRPHIIRNRTRNR